jgi:hypothetical protein
MKGALMNGSLGTTQEGAINSGVLGAAEKQQGAYNSGVLGAVKLVKQAGSVNSGVLGFHEPGAVRSGVLGEYFATNGLGKYTQSGAYNSGSLGAVRVPQNGAYRSGSLGEYFAANAMQGLGRTGCGCTGKPTSGLGATVRYVNAMKKHHLRGLGGALGTVSLDLDMIVGIALGAVGVWFAMGKKCTV